MTPRWITLPKAWVGRQCFSRGKYASFKFSLCFGCAGTERAFEICLCHSVRKLVGQCTLTHVKTIELPPIPRFSARSRPHSWKTGTTDWRFSCYCAGRPGLLLPCSFRFRSRVHQQPINFTFRPQRHWPSSRVSPRLMDSRR